MGCLVASLVGLDELATASSYFFKYYWPDWVPAIGRAPCSAARTISSSYESVRGKYLSQFLLKKRTPRYRKMLLLRL